MKQVSFIILFCFVASQISELNSQALTDIKYRSSFLNGTFPKPFNEFDNPHNAGAVSTGYYITTNETQGDLRPKESFHLLSQDVQLWKRIVQGSRIMPQNFWNNNSEGLAFFRNPALPSEFNGDFFRHSTSIGTDSTDNAIAGPIPIKLDGDFYFNGIRYDSFYVSTNGIIALTNRRYFYDNNGNRVIPQGRNSAYDPMSMAWFVGNMNDDNYSRKGNGLDTSDSQADDFGYKYAVLGGTPAIPTIGIRARGGSLSMTEPSVSGSPFQVTHKAALIAPLFGDNHLSQYSATDKKVDDHGKVFYKRTEDGKRLVIHFENLAPVGYVNTPAGNYMAAANLRPEDSRYISCNVQVVLNSSDSTITIIYQKFNGEVQLNGQRIGAQDVFLYNSSSGVRGFARHINFNRTDGPVNISNPNFPWAGEYEQYTHFHNYRRSKSDFNMTNRKLMFKQWQNTLRAVDLKFKTRMLANNAPLDFTIEHKISELNNFELLAGDNRLGAVQPVAIFQNLSNDIQGESGLHYIRQDLRFNARLLVTNKLTGRIVYNRLVSVDSLCMAVPEERSNQCSSDPDIRVRFSKLLSSYPDYDNREETFPGINPGNNKPRGGLSPYQYVRVNFPPFIPDANLKDEDGRPAHIGLLKLSVIAESMRQNTPINQDWFFDDTLSTNIYVMKRLEPFNETASEFHIIDGKAVPSVYKWVNDGADVVSGDFISKHPVPPLGEFKADNDSLFILKSPSFKMDRKDLNGNEHSPNPLTGRKGDEIRSFPIDLTNSHGTVISLAVQRVAYKESWDRGFGDGLLVGPEPRVILNNDRFQVYNHNPLSASFLPDELVVEFARPSDDGLHNILNIKPERWRDMPRRGGAPSETKNPALTIFGAGGYMTGFLENDPDSVLALPDQATQAINGLRANFYDDGFDEEYITYFVPIPDTIINWRNEGAKNFRFRVRVNADDDQKGAGLIPDDNDEFFVDNIAIIKRSSEQTDIAVTSVDIDWQYTQVPATQASSIPVLVKVANLTATNAPSYQVKVMIFRNEDLEKYSAWAWATYCRTVTVPVHGGQRELELNFPRWDARSSGGPGEYTAYALVGVPGGDINPENNITLHKFKINMGATLDFSPVENPKNDVPEFLGVQGRGLNLQAFANGGTGSVFSEGTFDRFLIAGGVPGGSISGQIAMKFELTVTDTIFGYEALFGNANSAPDFTTWRVYQDGGNIPGGQVVPGTYLEAQRGRDLERDPNALFYDEYVHYKLPNGIVLEGNRAYWIALGQPSNGGLELGASKYKGGMRTANINVAPPIQVVKEVGQEGRHLNLAKQNRQLNQQRNLLNKNFFAVENPTASGNWTQFSPTVGNPVYSHLNHFGTSPLDNKTQTLTRGTWIPLIRPYLGEKSYATGNEIWYKQYVHLADTVGFYCTLPVELVYFKGELRGTTADLFWETASEENNYGFFVERRVSEFEESDNSEWSQIAFIRGAGNSVINNYYNYSDEELMPNLKYEYRLRQVDFDGTESCDETNLVVLSYELETVLNIEQNSPNPFTDMTTINFTLNKACNVNLDVIDIYGNVVAKILDNVEFPSGTFSASYSGQAQNGKSLPSGSYVYRLQANDKTVSGIMTIIR